MIEKGRAWGETVPRPPVVTSAASDRELAALVAAGPADVALAVTAGDLHRTLGRPSGVTDGLPEVRRVTMDLLRCQLDGRDHVAVAHVVARRPGPIGWWRGPIHAVCTAQFIERWDVAPGSHPNDGWVEVIDVAATMTLRQRFLAWRRLPSGTSLPHPDIRSRRRRSAEWTWERPLDVYVDGVRHRRVHQLRVEVVADAYHLHL